MAQRFGAPLLEDGAQSRCGWLPHPDEATRLLQPTDLTARNTTMSTVLLEASNQLFSRPKDEQFQTLDALYADAKAQRDNHTTVDTNLRSIVAVPVGDSLVWSVAEDALNPSTAWGFEQICSKAKAPSRFMTMLPADQAAADINFGLKKLSDDQDVRLLFDTRSKVPSIRSVTSQKYERLWDAEICEALFEHKGTLTPAMESAKRGTDGEKDAPKSLYRGDRDSFIFLVDEEHRIPDGSDGGLARGVMIGGSEVGFRSIWVLDFLFRFVCCNHMVHGVESVTSTKRRHIGKGPREILRELPVILNKMMDPHRLEQDAEIVKAAMACAYADSDENAVRRLNEQQGKSKKFAERVIELAKEDPGGTDPLSLYGVVQGWTMAAKDSEHTNARVALEQEAGRMLVTVR